MERIQRRERAEQTALQEKHQRKVDRNILLDLPRSQHRHRHHDGREHHHQQTEAINANRIFDAQRWNPNVVLGKLQIGRGRIKRFPEASCQNERHQAEAQPQRAGQLLVLRIQSNEHHRTDQGRERQHGEDRKLVHDALHPHVKSRIRNVSATPITRK